MQARAWAAIALLASTLLGALFYLGNRMDSLGGRIDSQAARMDALAARVEEQGRQLGQGIYELTVKLDEHLRWHAS